MTKVVAITGGKGGTGKSTFSLLLAHKLRQEGKRVVLADLDVECPNDYLLLGLSLKKPVGFATASFPHLDKRKCRRCGLCAARCQAGAIFFSPGQYPVFLKDLCAGCGVCAHSCPYGAIKMRPEKIGAIYEQKVAPYFYLVTGQTLGVREESGPVVAKARAWAEKRAQKEKADYLLLDTAAGMHCGVIRALLGVDKVYAVTEPTPLGAHDLRLILALIKKLKLPAQIVLNQADLGEKALIEAVAREEKVEIKYRLPYSRELAKAYAQGRLGTVDFLRNIL